MSCCTSMHRKTRWRGPSIFNSSVPSISSIYSWSLMHIFTVDEFYIIKLRVLKNMLIIGNAHDSKYYHYIQKKKCVWPTATNTILGIFNLLAKTIFSCNYWIIFWHGVQKKSPSVEIYGTIFIFICWKLLYCIDFYILIFWIVTYIYDINDFCLNNVMVMLTPEGWIFKTNP
jgi:hypothetical protein